MEDLSESKPTTLSTVKKNVSDSHDYDFLVDIRHSFDKEERVQYRHDFLGMPNIPTVGRYSGAGYEFGKTIGLVAMDLKYDAGGSNEWITQVSKDSKEAHSINLPTEVQNLLINIPANIDDNKKDDLEGGDFNQKKKGGKKGGKGKQNQKQDGQNQKKVTDFFKPNNEEPKGSPMVDGMESNSEESKQSMKEQPKEQKKEPQPQPTLPYMPTEVVRFNWIIQLNDMFLPDKVKYNDKIFYNYVCHTLLFPVIDFSNTKRIISRTPICMVIPKGHEDCGVSEFVDSEQSKSKYYNGLSLNKLRREYSSVHLGKGMALCFSPNNMKIVVNRKEKISYFWTVILDEMLCYNQCYFHWLINDQDLFQLLQNETKNAKNLGELFKGFEDILGNKNELIQHTKLIFNLA